MASWTIDICQHIDICIFIVTFLRMYAVTCFALLFCSNIFRNKTFTHFDCAAATPTSLSTPTPIELLNFSLIVYTFYAH